MSIVGPRPVKPNHPEASDDYYFRQFDLPGIFSTATALGIRNDPEISINDIVSYDFVDAANPSLRTDLALGGPR